ncbi:Crp/Fnr family transcriptional regulator [Algiphilus sp. NNCM1]|nr:Crp/Fnr family transcriptional regulator [Algiphilus acroporae]MCI5063253.1 Crp/Fnr family transcriptional regulator [Algiphilus sp.]
MPRSAGRIQQRYDAEMRMLDRPASGDLQPYLGQWLDMAPVDFSPLLPYFRRCQFNAGDHLFQLGDATDDLVLLTEGLIRCYYVHGSREINLRLLSAPAAALPYRSFLDQRPADEALQALSNGAGFWVRFRAFCRDHPGLLAECMRRELAERHFRALQRRLHMLQSRNATERYAFYRTHMEPEIVAGTPAYHVASYLGIAPESLSRIKATLEKC